MANPTGLINGTKYLLLLGKTPIGAVFTSSQSYTKSLIEITNKSSEEFRDMIDGGTKSLDVSFECLFQSHGAYQLIRDAWSTGEIQQFDFAINGVVQNYPFYCVVENLADTGGLNEAMKTSFSLKSSGTLLDNTVVI